MLEKTETHVLKIKVIKAVKVTCCRFCALNASQHAHSRGRSAKVPEGSIRRRHM